MYKILAKGSFEMNLSNGKSKYMSGALGGQEDYTFNYKDNFKDDKHKQLALNYLNGSAANLNIKIGQFVWIHKKNRTVENRTTYQQYTAKITYKSLDNNQCREASVEYWKSKHFDATDFKLESATLQTGNSTMIPCDRMNK